MSIQSMDALAAYGASQARAKPNIGGESAALLGGAPAGQGFGEILSQSMSSAFSATQGAEAASFGAVTKTSDLVDVVSAVNSAELALETVVAVRDRMISAYQEVMRMPI
jgi:flagellar hook-basal body complex protein FliE